MPKTFFSKYKIPTKLHIPVTSFLFKWLFFALLVGVLAGSAAALLLVSLDFVTNIRESNIWLIGFLPLAGLGIG
ncbi:MAG: chloride channel protein, partial [Paludibacteraceae bacterium]|nr:chloride channel protein [Paludibacteraceae bacterium]MBP8628022.1 chloride channel protein [Paludibacteraceae bacterium]